VCAQKLKFDQLSVQQGLPAREVYNLFEDEKGYIWAFTEYGIAKHNGVRFIPVCKNISFDESVVYAVRRSLKGNMYFSNSKAQIYRVIHDSAFIINGMAEASKKIIEEYGGLIYDLLIDDSSDHVYFSTFRQSHLLSQNKVTELPSPYQGDSGIVYFKKIGDQYIMIKTLAQSGQKSYIRVMNDKDSLIGQIPYNATRIERSMIRELNGCYYILNNRTITLLGKGIKQEVVLNDALISIEPSPDGHIWVGTAKGLYEFNSRLQTLNRYFEDCIVSDILFDKAGGMWVSTLENGIYYCKNIHHTYYDNIQALSKNISLLRKVKDKLFIGTSSGYLFVNDNGPIKQISLGKTPSHLTDITWFNNQYLVGGKNALVVLNEHMCPVKSKLFRGVYGGQIGVYGFAHETNDDTLFFISASSIIKKCRNNDCLLRKKGLEMITRCISKRNQSYLIGTAKGLFLFDRRFYIPGYLNELRSKSILKLQTDRNQNTWICTKGNGLYLLSPRNKLIKVNNTPSESINNISFLHHTVLLLSTNKGLFANALHTLDNRSSWQLLLDDEVLAAEVYQDKIYVATKQGLVALDTVKLFNPRAPKFYLESVFVNAQPKEIRNAELSYWENDLYFNFDVLSYNSPGQAISYTLEGPSPGNGMIKGKQLHLQNLSPGYYMLNAYLPTPAMGNQPYFITLSFFIKPAFWQTGWFYLFVICLSVSVFVLIVWLIHRNFKRKEARKAMLIKQLAEYRLTALKAQINPHFISNSLSAVQQLIFNNEIDKANQYIAKFSLLIRYVLTYSDKSVTYLDNEVKIIDINIELEQLRFENQFVFEKEINENIQLNEIMVPTLITQPIIENAVWHGLLPLKGKRIPKLTLKIDLVDDNLVISVIDNGVGRKKPDDYTLRENRESKGTWLVTNWIENLNQVSAGKGAAIHFIDLLDEHNAPAGTQVNIVLPLEVLNGLDYEKDKMHHY
jgi:ligand-binding sensor domain-containing protein